jgi:cold-inducible RNA-binding protein
VGRAVPHERADPPGRHRDLVSRGFGFVEVETAEAANRAVAKLNGVQLDGRAPRVEISKPSALRSGGG